MNPIKKTILINVVVTFALFLAVEAAFQILEAANKPLTHKEFRLQQPEPYKGSGYYSKEFVEESFKQPGGWIAPPGTTLILPNNFHGTWFNVVNNRRVTVGQPASYTRRVLLFGGSTMYDSEVPDDQTIASQLQKLMNDAGLHVLVENWGVTTIHAGQQFEYLKRYAKLTPADIVVFYDGVNDVSQRVYYGDREGTIAMQSSNAPWVARFVRKGSKYLAFLRWVDRSFVTRNDFSGNLRLAPAAASEYGKIIGDVNTYVTGQGATFYHFFQPTLFTRRSHDAYETQLIASGNGIVPPGVQQIFTATYPLMQLEIKKYPFNTDLTAVLDNTAKSPYLDFVHVTEEGDGLIARAIFGRIRPALNE